AHDAHSRQPPRPRRPRRGRGAHQYRVDRTRTLRDCYLRKTVEPAAQAYQERRLHDDGAVPTHVRVRRDGTAHRHWWLVVSRVTNAAPARGRHAAGAAPW